MNVGSPTDSTSATAVRVPRFLLLPAVSRPSPASVPQPSIIATVAYSLPSATRTMQCNVPVPATLGPRAESDRLPTSAILRASVSDLRADARQPRHCRDKPTV